LSGGGVYLAMTFVSVDAETEATRLARNTQSVTDAAGKLATAYINAPFTLHSHCVESL